jgi:uncharacterized protein (DUF433 family)
MTRNADNSRYDDRPRYLLSQAARYVRISPATLRSWVHGRSYTAFGERQFFQPLITPPLPGDPRLSYSNLHEAHVLRALRTVHGVPMWEVRAAIDYAEKKLNIRRLLLSEELRARAGQILLEHLGEILELGRSGQMAMKGLFDLHLQRVEWSTEGFSSSFFPVNTSLTGPHVVSIHPRIAFGRPIIAGKGVRTQTIVERLDADEPRDALIADYGLTNDEIDEAVLYERAA